MRAVVAVSFPIPIGHAQAALAATLFHYKRLTVGDVKAYLKEQGVPVRT